MKLIVINTGVWRESKFDYGRNKRVTFKDIDNPTVYYYLNLTDAHGVVDKWLPFIEDGNILEVGITLGTHNVNKFGEVKLVKKGTKDGQ